MATPVASSWSWVNGDDEGRWARSFRMLHVAWSLLWRTGAMRAVAAIGCTTWLIATFLLFGPVLYAWVETDQRIVLVAGAAVAAYPFLVVTVFCNVALLAAAGACMDGHRLTARESFATARRRLPQILGWALLAAGVGALLDAIAGAVPAVGGLLSWLLGVAWSLATLFAVPVIALEGLGGRAAARRSAQVFRDTWGESVIGVVSVTACAAILAWPACVLIGAGGLVGTTPLGLALLAAGVLLAATAGFAATLMEQCFALALYRYARDGSVDGGYREQDLREGMRLKSRRRQD